MRNDGDAVIIGRIVKGGTAEKSGECLQPCKQILCYSDFRHGSYCNILSFECYKFVVYI